MGCCLTRLYIYIAVMCLVGWLFCDINPEKLTRGIPAFGTDCSLSPTSSEAGLAMLCTKQTIIPTLTTYGGGRLP